MAAIQYEDLAHSSNWALEGIFRSAIAPSPEALVGYEWRGYNISSFARHLGIQKFIKGFFTSGGRTEGYNITVLQNDLTDPWIPTPSVEHPKRYAFFIVSHENISAADNLYPQALLFNYGVSTRNPPVAVERLLRDYLVQPDPHNSDLMLSKAYFAIGPWRVFSNFFIIERLRHSSWHP